MAVVGTAKLLSRQHTGTNRFNQDTREVTYKVVVDDEDDGAETVLLATGLPALLSIYAYGNDTNAAMFLLERVPRKVSTKRWHIVCKYVENPFPRGQGGELQPPVVTDNSNLSNDPEDFRKTVVPGFVMVSVPNDNAEFVGYLDNDKAAIADKLNAKLVVGDKGPITNSAGVPPIPAPERLVSIETVRVTYVKQIWPTNLKTAHLAFNSAAWTLRRNDGLTEVYERTFAIREAWLREITADQIQIGYSLYYKIQLTFWIKDGGWYHDELDRGLAAKAAAGDPDGHGGTISSSQLYAGIPELRIIRDPRGAPIREPVLFDGLGQPLDPPDRDDAIYLRFKDPNEYDFNNITDISDGELS